ncbi:hypothetical protein [Winogradskyella flava]|nr:hypothetical protein [Winogradskyella flava]
MKTKTTLPETTQDENIFVSNLKDTVRVIEGVLKLTKKLFML